MYVLNNRMFPTIPDKGGAWTCTQEKLRSLWLGRVSYTWEGEAEFQVDKPLQAVLYHWVGCEWHFEK